MQQVAARLHFTRPAQVGRVHSKALERIAARQHEVVVHDGAEFERKGVERSRELVPREQQRRRERQVVPLRRALGARAKVV